MLNENQQKAVDTLQGQVCLVACPGSGKTTVIVNRANNLIKHGVNPANILVITFTNQAANDMKKRYEDNFGEDGILFGTIHSLCFRVLQKKYGYKREDILKPSEQMRFFYETVIRKKFKTDDLDNYVKTCISEVSCIRNSELEYRKFKPSVATQRDFIYLYEQYIDFKKNLGKVDFDDMICTCKHLFETDFETLHFWQNQFRYIMIDEFQDTNKIQAEIFYMLAGRNGNICIVGDDDQSIYKFRAADFRIMLGFTRYYPNATTIPLTTNYRSQECIVRHAAQLINHNEKRFKKDFLAFRGTTDGTVTCQATESPMEEACLILRSIEKKNEQGTPFQNMAVLYRTNSQNQLLIGKLLKASIPFYSTEAPKDYHDDMIFKDIMAYYRLSHGCARNGDAQKVLNHPGRYIKNDIFKGVSSTREAFISACEKLPTDEQFAAKIKIREFFSDLDGMKNIVSPKQFVRHIGFMLNYRNWLKDYARYCKKDEDEYLSVFDMLWEESKEFETMEEWQKYADYYAEELQKKRKERKKDGVCLSTFHSSKGLEWENVFIIDANENVTPSKHAETQEDFEEERRCFYVAATRAKDHLTILFTTGNGDSKRSLSRFVSEMHVKVSEYMRNE